MNRNVTILGGILMIVSMFLPFVSVLDQSTNGMAMGGVAYFYIVVGVIVGVVGFVDKRWLNILNLILGLCVAGLAFKYSSDTTELGGKAGIGIWMLLGGGVIAMVGAVMGLMKKTA